MTDNQQAKKSRLVTKWIATVVPDCAPFRIYVGDLRPQLIPVMLREMSARGAQVSGDETAGSFSIPLPIGGSIRGRFEMQGKSIAVQIDQRPAAVSCGTIESKLQDFILDAKAILKNSDESS